MCEYIRKSDEYLRESDEYLREARDYLRLFERTMPLPGSRL